ncbi:MAG TPA: GWxTD domain-containing protein [Candidatus Saccharicenans sp.]|jgi:GWxTD domain-containing protein|nr:GWxTD domain-containing protein [Candidatus Saccharicenans sp.]HRD02997.1 GWxTD domain-containing protein [Candidatus Saccharicenans sp.]
MLNDSKESPKRLITILSFLLSFLFLFLIFQDTVNSSGLGTISSLQKNSSSLQPKKKEKKPHLPKKYEKWLNEEVVYIITPAEREIFLKLQTDRERDLFIEAFWKHRDPIPETEENEFRTEHYKRIEYANKRFGREAAKPGWKTDRGRVYIILGPPNFIESYKFEREIYDAEIWFYQGKTDLGLPPAFNLVFFQAGGMGELRLYSPSNDGPQALLTGFWGDQFDFFHAWEQLDFLYPNLAAVSLSLIPGEETISRNRPSMSSDLLLGQINETPRKLVDDKYARRFIEFKDIVEVDYSANYVNSDHLVKVFKNPAGIYMIHYSLEPKRLSVKQHDDRFITSLKVNGTLSTLAGKIIYQFEKSYPVQMTEFQMKERLNMPFAIYDVIPCVPGDYKLSVLVKNEGSKEFANLEQTISIRSQAGVEMSAPVLAFNSYPVEAAADQVKAFLISGYQLQIQAGRTFTPRDQLAVGLQIHGLTPAQRDRSSLRFQFFKETKLFKEKVVPLSEIATLPDVLELFSLADFPPAHYNLTVSLMIDGQTQITAREEFELTGQHHLPRPWALTRVLPSTDHPYYAYTLGIQLHRLGRLSEAQDLLERALAKAPGDEELSKQLAQVYLDLGDFGKAANLLEIFLQDNITASYETYLTAGQAFYNLSEYQRALNVLDKAINHYGNNINLLNMVGDCYLGLGKKAEARAIWEKSLELMADQPEIRKKIQSLNKE